MADQTIALLPAWYVADGATRRWVTPDNARPQILQALRAVMGTDMRLRVVNLRVNNDRFFLNFATGQTGEDVADLSDAWETGGQLRLAANDATWTLDFDAPGVTGPGTTDPYGFTFTGDALARFEAFRDGLSGQSGMQGGALTLWDGQGTSPFDPAPPPVDPPAEPVEPLPDLTVAVWPATLPQGLEVDGHALGLPAPLTRAPRGRVWPWGRLNARRGREARVEGAMLMDTDEYTTFVTWYEQALGGGVLDFDGPALDGSGGRWQMAFAAPPGATPVGDGVTFSVDLQLTRLR
ncbi:MAG: hypothetical protein OXE76_03985 [Alphaproteobacteria bacterium]|nr:hypothetical protein [Alphaproteobacteria bacterium]